MTTILITNAISAAAAGGALSVLSIRARRARRRRLLLQPIYSARTSSQPAGRR